MGAVVCTSVLRVMNHLFCARIISNHLSTNQPYMLTQPPTPSGLQYQCTAVDGAEPFILSQYHLLKVALCRAWIVLRWVTILEPLYVTTYKGQVSLLPAKNCKGTPYSTIEHYHSITGFWS